MPIATLLAIASAFWGGMGYTVPPQTWDWEFKQPEPTGYLEEGHAYMGSNHITLNRVWWDNPGVMNAERCSVVVHEVGHAALSMPHKAGTVMDPDGAMFPPNICQPKTTPTTKVRTASESSKRNILRGKSKVQRRKLARRHS